jgi:hypothetical protein
LNEPRASEVDRACANGSAREKCGPDAGEDNLTLPHAQKTVETGTRNAVLAGASQNDSAVDSQLQVMIDGWE